MKPICLRLAAGLLLIGFCAAQALAGPPTDEPLNIGFDVEALRNTNRADVEAALSLWAGEITQAISVPAKSLSTRRCRPCRKRSGPERSTW